MIWIMKLGKEGVHEVVEGWENGGRCDQGYAWSEHDFPALKGVNDC